MFDSSVYFNNMLKELRMSKSTSLYDIVIPKKFKNSACIGLDLTTMCEYEDSGIEFDIIDKEDKKIYRVKVEKNQFGEVSNYMIVEISESKRYVNCYSCECDECGSTRFFRLTSVTKTGIYTTKLMDRVSDNNDELLVLHESFYDPETSVVIGDAFLEPSFMDKTEEFGIYSDIDFNSKGIQMNGMFDTYNHFKQMGEFVMSYEPNIERVLN